jgi:hypothetical protein
VPALNGGRNGQKQPKVLPLYSHFIFLALKKVKSMKKILLVIMVFSVQNSDTMTKDISTYMKKWRKN